MTRATQSLMVVVVCLHVLACAQTIQRGAIASRQVAQTTEAIQTAETAVFDAGHLTLEQHQWWAQMFVGVADGLLGVNAGLRASQTAAVHSAVEGTLAFVDGMVAALDAIPEPTKSVINVLLSTLRAVLVAMSVI